MNGTSIRDFPPPQQQRSPVVTEGGAMRVVLAGSHLSNLVIPESIMLTERLWRRNPVEGTLTATPSAPFRFELGSLDVPANQVFVVLDWRFAIYVPSGLVAGNTRELEDRQLATCVGYDVRFSANRPINQVFELEPSDPATLNQPLFQPSPLSAGFVPDADAFNRIRANTFSSTLGSGLSTLPQRHRRDSQLAMQFTYIVPAKQRINLQAVVFRPINMPVSFFEGELSGFFMGSADMEKFVKGVALSTTVAQ